MRDAISLLLQLRFIGHVIGSSLNEGGPVFLALCMFPPLIRHFMSSDLWTKGTIVDANLTPSVDWPVRVAGVSLRGQCSEQVLHS